MKVIIVDFPTLLIKDPSDIFTVKKSQIHEMIGKYGYFIDI